MEKERKAVCKKDELSRCNQCNKEFEAEEVVRVYGDVLWKFTYCSAQCYTKAALGGKRKIK